MRMLLLTSSPLSSSMPIPCSSRSSQPATTDRVPCRQTRGQRAEPANTRAAPQGHVCVGVFEQKVNVGANDHNQLENRRRGRLRHRVQLHRILAAKVDSFFLIVCHPSCTECLSYVVPSPCFF